MRVGRKCKTLEYVTFCEFSRVNEGRDGSENIERPET